MTRYFMKAITGGEDHIDVDHLCERLDYLRDLEEEDELDERERTELEILDYIDSNTDLGNHYANPYALIRSDLIGLYAEDYVKQNGLITDTDAWPFSFINWERAAEELLIDNEEFEINGTDYYLV